MNKLSIWRADKLLCEKTGMKKVFFSNSGAEATEAYKKALGLELFRNLGIEPTERKLVVVKSTNHFMGAFGPIAKKVIYVETDAPLTRDYRKIPYTRVMRPIWPLDAETRPGLIY